MTKPGPKHPYPGLVTLTDDVLDQIIVWRLNDPTINQPEEGQMAQRQWHIELRMDFADEGRNVEIDKAVVETKEHLAAMLELLCDGQKPNIIAYSDDWFHGKREIEDVLGQAKEAYAGKVGETMEVSDEMKEALNQLKKP